MIKRRENTQIYGVLTGFIQQEIVKGVELAMKDLMEQMIVNKTEYAKTTITSFME
jgi:hypothetical protein